MLFEFNFNSIGKDAASVDVALVYSQGYLSTPRRVHTLYVLHLDSLDAEGAMSGPPDADAGRHLWNVLKLGMTVDQVKTALARQPTYVESGMTPALGTVFISSYDVGDVLRLNFHDGRLFSYRAALEPSPDRESRRRVLGILAGEYQGVMVSSDGQYVADRERNSDEFMGTGEGGVKVETQGDWALIYDEAVLKEVQRLEYQGR